MRKKKQQRLVFDPTQTNINQPPRWKVTRKRGREVETESSTAATKKKNLLYKRSTTSFSRSFSPCKSSTLFSIAPSFNRRAFRISFGREISTSTSFLLRLCVCSDGLLLGENNEAGTEEKMMASLDKTLRYSLKAEINQAISAKKDTGQLKSDILARKILPRGTFSAAEKDAGVKSSELDKLMKRRKTRPIDFYQEFVREQFDSLLIEVMLSSASVQCTLSSSSMQSLRAPTTSMQFLRVTEGKEESKDEEESEDEDEEEAEFRTVSYPLRALLRSDLAADIHGVVLNTLETTLRASVVSKLLNF